MTNSKSLPEGTGGDNRIKVDVPLVSDEYQFYLNALKERERLREEHGGDTSEGVELVRKASAGVGELAKGKYQQERSN